MSGGGAAGAMLLLLLFRAARCERTFQTTHTHKKEEHSAGAWVSLHARVHQQAGACG